MIRVRLVISAASRMEAKLPGINPRTVMIPSAAIATAITTSTKLNPFFTNLVSLWSSSAVIFVKFFI
jgi:hypothetical protein